MTRVESSDLSSTARYQIISFDGGGIRSLLAITLLQRIEEARLGFVGRAKLFAGTSAGSFTALALAALPDSLAALSQLQQLWMDPSIFDVPLRKKILAAMGFEALVPVGAMAQALTRVLGDRRVGSIKPNIVIPAFELDDRNPNGALRSWRPRLFNNFHEADDDNFLVDIALRSSAFPIMSPIHQGYADGGLFADNPSMTAIATAIEANAARLDDIVLISFGAGSNQMYMEGQNNSWGYIRWMIDPTQPLALATAFIDATNAATVHQSEMFLTKNRFCRVDIVLNPSLMQRNDSVEIANSLIHAAWELDISPILDWIDRSGWFGPAVLGGEPA